MLIVRLIGLCWIVGPFIILSSPDNQSGEMFAIGIFSIIMGIILLRIKPKENIKLNYSSNKYVPSLEQHEQKKVIVREPKIKLDNANDETDTIAAVKNNPKVKEEESNIKIRSSMSKIEFKRINYTPSTIFEQEEPYDYPVVKMPKKDSYIKISKVGRSNKIGYTENQFFIVLEQYFKPYFNVYNNRHIVSKEGSYKYEPDFLIESVDTKKNIFIDIEIDEPYDGISRIPTHELNIDKPRDLFFTNRGYIVVRFTEKQVFEEAYQCCEYIANVIKTIEPDYFVYQRSTEMVISKQKQWDSLQAKKWALVNYRENYLGITGFGSREFYEYDFNFENSHLDDLVESKIDDLDISKTIFNDNLPLKGNIAHVRDKRILFDSENHKYYIDENPDTISVSQLIDKFFPEFDAIKAAKNLNSNNELYGLPVEEIVKRWKDKGIKAAELGTKLHQQIENYYKKIPNESTSIEFEYFLKFKEKYPTMIPHRTEWRIFDEDYLIAGTIDMIYKKEDGTFYIFDWKRSEKVITHDGKPKLSDPNHPFSKFAYGELKHLTDDSYYKYVLQQNIYKYILEKKYDYTINSINLLILHPKYQTFYWLKLPNMQKEVEYMINELKTNKK